MAELERFTLGLEDLTEQSFVGELWGHHWRLDKGAKEYLSGKYERQSLPLDHTIECALLTIKDMGFSWHPRHDELLNVEHLYAASRELLPEGYVFRNVDARCFLAFLVEETQRTKGRSVIPLMGSARGERVLESHVSSVTKETWLYGVRAPLQEKRWPKSAHVLMRVCVANEYERSRIRTASHPYGLGGKMSALCPRKPVVQDDVRPGLYCGHAAVNSVLGAFGKGEVEFKDLRRNIPIYGRVVNDWLGRMILPGDVRYFLKQNGIKAESEYWPNIGEWKGLPISFEERLRNTVANLRLVVVLSYAQRRLHGQHFVVVSGYEEYGGKLYWYVTDGQFEQGEYDLPSGNALYSTGDFKTSFPHYELLFKKPGAYVTKLVCH